jgi:hypothetical protein
MLTTSHHTNKIFLSLLPNQCMTGPCGKKLCLCRWRRGRCMQTCDRFLCSCPTQTDIKMRLHVGDALRLVVPYTRVRGRRAGSLGSSTARMGLASSVAVVMVFPLGNYVCEKRTSGDLGGGGASVSSSPISCLEDRARR